MKKPSISAARQMLASVTALFAPRVCTVCGSGLGDSERHICTACINRLPRTGYHRMPGNPLEQRLAGKIPFERASAHFFYSRDAAIATIIQDFKYSYRPSLARLMGELAGSELLPTGFLSGIDVIAPVPLHMLRQCRRGYNQSREISIGLSEATGIPLTDNLYARRSHHTQTRRTPEERRRNVEGVFALREPRLLEGKHILVTDDVCTTGATIAEAITTIAGATSGCRFTIFTLASAGND